MPEFKDFDYDFSDDEESGNTTICTTVHMARGVLMTFGKHKGSKIGDLMKDKKTRSYLKWAAEKSDRISMFEASAIEMLMSDYRKQKYQARLRRMDEKVNI